MLSQLNLWTGIAAVALLVLMPTITRFPGGLRLLVAGAWGIVIGLTIIVKTYQMGVSIWSLMILPAVGSLEVIAGIMAVVLGPRMFVEAKAKASRRAKSRAERELAGRPAA